MKIRSYPIFIFLLVCSCSAHHDDPYEGTWQAIEKAVPLTDHRELPQSMQRFARPLFKSMEVHKLGKLNVQYNVRFDGQRRLTFRKLNDTT